MGTSGVASDGVGAWPAGVLGNTDLVCGRKSLRCVRNVL